MQCPGCGYNSLIKLQPLLTATSVACPRCRQMVAAAAIEAGNPKAAGLLGIMRQLALAKEARSQPPREEPALAVGAPLPRSA